VPVAKHGNRSVSSLSGASDVLAALGVKLDVPPITISRAIGAAGVGFMWAPMHHPAMKHWAPVRAELGIRTIFNLLGPLSNPAGVKRQILGGFDDRWVVPLAEVLENLGPVHAWVVHGADGLDELSTTGPTRVAELKGGAISVFEVTPEDAGLARVTLKELKGGDARANAAAIRDVLAGEPGPFRDIVVLNAAAALIVSGKAADLGDGVKRAARAIDTGAAAQALDKLVAISNGACALSLAAVDLGGEGRQLLADGDVGALLDAPVGGGHRLAELGDLRAAPARPARRGQDERPVEHAVERLDQQPGAAVRHAHLAARGRDRSLAVDRLDEIDLSRA
jgi:hypothetical protein